MCKVHGLDSNLPLRFLWFCLLPFSLIATSGTLEWLDRHDFFFFQVGMPDCVVTVAK